MAERFIQLLRPGVAGQFSSECRPMLSAEFRPEKVVTGASVQNL